MFPLSFNSYIVIVLVIIAGAGFSYGRYEHMAYIEYKTEVKSIADKQQAKNIEVAKEQALINKGISNEYQAKLSAIRAYYGGMHNSSSGAMPSLSNPAAGVNGSSADQLLACAATTQQLVSLQDWVKEQSGL